MTSSLIGKVMGWIAAGSVVLVAGCTRESAPEPGQPTQGAATAAGATPNAQGVSVQFSSDPNPPASGDNQIEVRVTENGAPVTDATVEAVFSMPAMPSMNMPAMRSAAPLTHAGGGVYRGTGQLSMGGTWTVTVTASRSGQEIGRTSLSIVAK